MFANKEDLTRNLLVRIGAGSKAPQKAPAYRTDAGKLQAQLLQPLPVKSTRSGSSSSASASPMHVDVIAQALGVELMADATMETEEEAKANKLVEKKKNDAFAQAEAALNREKEREAAAAAAATHDNGALFQIKAELRLMRDAREQFENSRPAKFMDDFPEAPPPAPPVPSANPPAPSASPSQPSSQPADVTCLESESSGVCVCGDSSLPDIKYGPRCVQWQRARLQAIAKATDPEQPRCPCQLPGMREWPFSTSRPGTTQDELIRGKSGFWGVHICNRCRLPRRDFTHGITYTGGLPEVVEKKRKAGRTDFGKQELEILRGTYKPSAFATSQATDSLTRMESLGYELQHEEVPPDEDEAMLEDASVTDHGSYDDEGPGDEDTGDSTDRLLHAEEWHTLSSHALRKNAAGETAEQMSEEMQLVHDSCVLDGVGRDQDTDLEDLFGTRLLRELEQYIPEMVASLSSSHAPEPRALEAKALSIAKKFLLKYKNHGPTERSRTEDAELEEEVFAAFQAPKVHWEGWIPVDPESKGSDAKDSASSKEEEKKKKKKKPELQYAKSISFETTTSASYEREKAHLQKVKDLKQTGRRASGDLLAAASICYASIAMAAPIQPAVICSSINKWRATQAASAKTEKKNGQQIALGGGGSSSSSSSSSAAPTKKRKLAAVTSVKDVSEQKKKDTKGKKIVVRPRLRELLKASNVGRKLKEMLRMMPHDSAQPGLIQRNYYDYVVPILIINQRWTYSRARMFGEEQVDAVIEELVMAPPEKKRRLESSSSSSSSSSSGAPAKQQKQRKEKPDIIVSATDLRLLPPAVLQYRVDTALAFPALMQHTAYEVRKCAIAYCNENLSASKLRNAYMDAGCSVDNESTYLDAFFVIFQRIMENLWLFQSDFIRLPDRTEADLPVQTLLHPKSLSGLLAAVIEAAPTAGDSRRWRDSLAEIDHAMGLPREIREAMVVQGAAAFHTTQAQMMGYVNAFRGEAASRAQDGPEGCEDEIDYPPPKTKLELVLSVMGRKPRTIAVALLSLVLRERYAASGSESASPSSSSSSSSGAVNVKNQPSVSRKQILELVTMHTVTLTSMRRTLAHLFAYVK